MSGQTSKKQDLVKMGQHQEFPFYSLLTKVLVKALCPLMRSEIMFGNMMELTEPEKVAYSFGIKISGDLEGEIGIGTDRHVLRSLAMTLQLKKDGQADVQGALQKLRVLLADTLRAQFIEEEFRCTLATSEEIRLDQVCAVGDLKTLICPVETKFGVLKVLTSLQASASEILDEIHSRSEQREPRKIRVFASQLDQIFYQVKDLEKLEAKLLSGPHVRAKMRSEIKKLKRSLVDLKSESLELLFSPARRLATEIAKQEGKQVKVNTHGTWLHLDKTLLNYLYEPILHLIRNAVDHGIEEPAERERVGKSSIGNIRCMAAFGEKGLRMIISDDGSGLNLSKIREAAVAKGLMGMEEANKKLSSEICDLVFAQGFSTRSHAGAISGRGLGLDIVRRGIEAINGTIRILSTSHHGTSFEICIPLGEDFTLVHHDHSRLGELDKENEERIVLLDELQDYFDRFNRAIHVLKKDKSITAAYEAYRLAHSIKGVSGFLGWHRVTSFAHHLEDLLKLISEEKAEVDDRIVLLVQETASRLKEFCDISIAEGTYPLFEIRKLESRIMQEIWAVTGSEERTHFYFGKYHLNSVEKLLASSFLSGGKFKVKPATNFTKALTQPFGTLIQFSGDRRGYASILLSEACFSKVIHPFITGSYEESPIKTQVWALAEFAVLMGNQLAESASKAGIELNPSAPMTYYGWGQPLRILGNPTYCYECEFQGQVFYLAGDFRSTHEAVERLAPEARLGFEPNIIIQQAMLQCESHFSQWNIPVAFEEISDQSELIGFDGGITAIISCVNAANPTASSVLFMSYEPQLADYIHKAFVGEHKGDAGSEKIDLYDCLNETSNIVGGRVIAELEKRRLHLSLSLPSVFIGKAYVANFNRLFVTNKLVGTTPQGRFELQLLVTKVD